MKTFAYLLLVSSAFLLLYLSSRRNAPAKLIVCASLLFLVAYSIAFI